MSHLKPLLLFVLLSPLLHPQAIVQQTNCPKHLTAGTIVAAQAVSTLANYPVIILACYTLDPADFSVTVGAPGTTPVLHTIGGGGGGGGTSATLCVPASNSSTAYTCPSASLGTYANGVNLIFQPDVSSGVSPTVDIAGLGPKPLLYNDGTNFSTGGLQSGLSYLFVYDGAFFRVPSNRLVAAGGSCLTTDYSQNPPTVAEQAGCFFGLTANNAPTGFNNFSGALIRLPESTVANLPAASSNGGKEFWVTDGAGSTDCSSGGGSTFVNFCRAEGSSWVYKGGVGASQTLSGWCSGGVYSGGSTGNGADIFGLGVSSHTNCGGGFGGSSANGTLISNTSGCQLQNLFVLADTASSTTGDGVVTVQTRTIGATSLTCTLGTSHFCNDVTHKVSVAFGDLVYVTVAINSAAIHDLNISMVCQ